MKQAFPKRVCLGPLKFTFFLLSPAEELLQGHHCRTGVLLVLLGRSRHRGAFLWVKPPQKGISRFPFCNHLQQANILLLLFLFSFFFSPLKISKARKPRNTKYESIYIFFCLFWQCSLNESKTAPGTSEWHRSVHLKLSKSESGSCLDRELSVGRRDGVAFSSHMALKQSFWSTGS